MAKVTKNNLEYPYNALAIILDLPETVTVEIIQSVLFPDGGIELETFLREHDMDDTIRRILGEDMYARFKARYKDAMTYNEISETLGKSREVNRQRIIHAIQTLKTEFIPEINKEWSECKLMHKHEEEELHTDEPVVTFVEEAKAPEDANATGEAISEMNVSVATDDEDSKPGPMSTSVHVTSGDDVEPCESPEDHVCSYKKEKRGIRGLLRKIFKR